MNSPNESNNSTSTSDMASSTTVSTKVLQTIMNEDEIMKRKLLINGDGKGDDTNISNIIKSFLSWCYNDSESESDSQLSAERILNAIDQSEMAMIKSVQTIKMVTHELDNYETIYKNIENSIINAKDKLENCKMELAEAKRIRCNKFDYDTVASLIEKHPSTQDTQTKLSHLEGEIESLQSINSSIETKLEKRRRQFQLLLSASHQLQCVLDEDSPTTVDGSTNSHGKSTIVGNETPIMMETN
ncbi:hypothetical protein RDWZM_007228 [Blomia tropicalis]|uniref:Uncharacterized protein n=1 Tax=Blomia tropicalis TaxID=40697 RepID=A0A9Q0M8Q5_BLOTA|nr:THO complex subunit 7 [Blomia tropicalis]KAJ6221416.1 hypothetical protein RDWZM_007228 [Blomia tropicalis]